MFAYKYLKEKDLYYSTDLFLLKNCHQFKNCTNISVHCINSQGVLSKPYSWFLKTALLLNSIWSGSSLFSSKKEKKTIFAKMQYFIFKRERKSFLSILFCGKKLIVQKFGLASQDLCLNLSLKNLFLFPRLQHLFLNLLGELNFSVLVTVQSQKNLFLFNCFESIAKKKL